MGGLIYYGFGRATGLTRRGQRFIQAEAELRYQFWITALLLAGGFAIGTLQPSQWPDVKMGLGLLITYWFGHRQGAKSGSGEANRGGEG